MAFNIVAFIRDAFVSAIHTSEYQFLLERLREARRQSGLTQAQVAAALGKQQSFVSKTESGERRIDPTELHRFAKLYNKRIDFFLPAQ